MFPKSYIAKMALLIMGITAMVMTVVGIKGFMIISTHHRNILACLFWIAPIIVFVWINI